MLPRGIESLWIFVFAVDTFFPTHFGDRKLLRYNSINLVHASRYLALRTLWFCCMSMKLHAAGAVLMRSDSHSRKQAQFSKSLRES